MPTLAVRNGAVNVEKLVGNSFCGKSSIDAAQCRSASKCSNGSDDECDNGQKCFKGIICDNNNFCGESSLGAAQCQKGKECPSGLSSECDVGEGCFEEVTCEKVIDDCDNYCGKSSIGASQCKLQDFVRHVCKRAALNNGLT